MQICPNCQVTHPTHQLTCRRCGQYMSSQGEVEYAGNPLIVWLVIGALVFVLGFGGWMWMKGQQSKPVQAEDASATPIKTASKPNTAVKSAAQTKKSRKKRQR